MKPFQIIVLAIFAILAVIGLFLFATYTGLGGKGEDVGEVTIWGTLPAGAMNDTINVLTGEFKEYKGVRYVEMSPADFERDLAEALASGSGPDLILITQEQLLAQKNKISVIPYESISERTYVSTYTPLFEKFLTPEGSYGVPFLIDPLVLYYNRSILSTAGVPEPPTTWEAVTGLTERLTVKRDDQSLVRSAIPFGEYGNVMNARAIVSLLLLQSGNAITDTSTGALRSVLETGGGGNAAPAAALNFYTQFSNPVKTVYTWNRAMPNSQSAFLGGSLALYPGYASERPFLSAANPNLDFDMAKIPQPSTITSPATYGLAYVFAIPRATGNFAGAFRSAVALGFPKSMQAAANALSMAPARRALLTSYPDRYAEVYYPQALIARGWLSPAPLPTDSVFSVMIDNITTGRKDVSGAVLSAHQSLNAQLP